MSESLYGLGKLHLAMGDEAAARPLLERALDISRKPSRLRGAGRSAPIPSERLHQARVLSALGTLMGRTGETDEARRTHDRAIELLEQTFGPDHPELAKIESARH